MYKFFVNYSFFKYNCVEIKEESLNEKNLYEQLQNEIFPYMYFNKLEKKEINLESFMKYTTKSQICGEFNSLEETINNFLDSKKNFINLKKQSLELKTKINEEQEKYLEIKEKSKMIEKEKKTLQLKTELLKVVSTLIKIIFHAKKNGIFDECKDLLQSVSQTNNYLFFYEEFPLTEDVYKKDIKNFKNKINFFHNEIEEKDAENIMNQFAQESSLKNIKELQIKRNSLNLGKNFIDTLNFKNFQRAKNDEKFSNKLQNAIEWHNKNN